MPPSQQYRGSGADKKNISFDESSLSHNYTDDGNQTQERTKNPERSRVGDGLTSDDFNDRLMKLSKTADSLKCRLSDETKVIAHKINPRK